ncbi:Uncharacterized membrane protein [Seinonella peptonophila]|uniref:Uncharacterized membrane protein n=1 Tax=Seinonella peptonophila TaxID=112248 RepID=A0A1M4WD55_9BACL|nr:DUF502 domain-containing protein [Seinonella peptonophila]SHE78902.1 Uncharacterized membrane protein [Seinonella peptonophila]
MLRTIGRQISICFFNGLLVSLPIVGTIYLLNYAYQLLNDLGLKWLIAFLPKTWQFPGSGLLFILILVCLIGFFARLWITKILLEWFEGFIKKIPLVKGLYGVLRDTMQSFLGEKRSFDTVVLVEHGNGKRMGFLTVKKAMFLSQDGKEYVGVYFPQSLQVSGDLYWCERGKVEILDMPVDEALQLILSAGIAGQK